METDKPKNKGGRPVGAMSRLAKEARERALATGELPHEFLLRVARGEIIKHNRIKDQATGECEVYYEAPDFERRVDAAKAAAPYYAPKISTVEVITGVSDDELDAIIAGAAAEAEVSVSFGGEGEEKPPAQAARERRRASPA